MAIYNKILSRIFSIKNYELFGGKPFCRLASRDILLHDNKILCWERGKINYNVVRFPECGLSCNYYINDGLTSKPFFKTSTNQLLENTDLLVTTKTLGNVETKTYINSKGIRTYKDKKTILPGGTVSMERYKYNEKGVEPTLID